MSKQDVSLESAFPTTTKLAVSPDPQPPSVLVVASGTTNPGLKILDLVPVSTRTKGP